MTLLEALLALVIAFGVITSALEASRTATNRSAIAHLEAEAALDAEALLSRVGTELPLNPGRLEGQDGNGEHWVVDVGPEGMGGDALRAYQIKADVRIARAGLSAHSSVATLKLRWTK